MLKLTYHDKYRLWRDLVRSSGDRLFVASAEAVQLGAAAKIEIQLPDHGMPIVVEAQVVGRRGKSRRFQAGAYVRIPDYELEKCRRFLGLRRPGEANARARRSLRVHHDLEVRFVEPPVDGASHTLNVSETGLFIVGEFDLAGDQQVSVELMLADGALQLDALVAWAEPDQKAAGLELVDVTEATADRLRAAIEAIAAEHQRNAGQGPRPIVVADDHPDILNLLHTALSRHGYEVYQATDGDRAIALVRRLQPSLVVLDVLLPGVDGSHVCKTMRADAEMSDIPVILVSALDSADLHAVADECGATDYLNKPLHLGELLDMLGAYLAV
jgi:CheY-like chemotaxis protein